MSYLLHVLERVKHTIEALVKVNCIGYISIAYLLAVTHCVIFYHNIILLDGFDFKLFGAVLLLEVSVKKAFVRLLLRKGAVSSAD
jgi:predicted HAD superfamily hydrolase